MSKAKKIILLVSVVAIIALLIVAHVTGGAKGTVDCPDCKDGTEECSACDASGEVKGKVCETCEGAKFVDCDTCAAKKVVTGSIWALFPPIVAIGLALITKEVYSSLFAGVLTGALLYADFSFTKTIDAITSDGLISAVSDSAGIFIFLIELGIIVALINRAGGSAAFGNWAKRNIKSRTGAMLATFVLGVLIFVDDYFNCLTVGSVMLPVTDSKKVSRAKLAYIIDATAAPICMIAPISSWAAAVSGYAPEGVSGIEMFIKAIPFNFYSLFTLVFIVAICLLKVDYGPMKLHEKNAIERGDLFTSGEKNEDGEVLEYSSRGRVIDLILPVIILVVSCVSALVYVGFQADGVNNIIDAFANTDATVGLPWGGIIALVLIVIYLIVRKIVNFKEAMSCVPKGFIAMVPAILILTLATALKNMTSGLGAKYFIGDLVRSSAGYSFVIMFLPVIIFLVACFLSFATGTSWGTFGILIPIVLSIFGAENAGDTITIICMSACLAGAVCGDHCSPISDTTIMSSAGGKCNHLNHVYTQMPYALTVAGISAAMFLISGLVAALTTKLSNGLSFGIGVAICLPVGIILTVGTLLIIKLVDKIKSKQKA